MSALRSILSWEGHLSLQDNFGNIRMPRVPTEKAGHLVIIAAAGLALVMVALSSWYTVDQGERGVVLRNGAVVSEAEPGLGFKIPLF